MLLTVAIALIGLPVIIGLGLLLMNVLLFEPRVP